jgi:hypothetical protein
MLFALLPSSDLHHSACNFPIGSTNQSCPVKSFAKELYEFIFARNKI